MAADPWALLREARDTLDSEASTPEELDFVARIDAALAESRDSATDVVESDEPSWSRMTPSGYRAAFRSASLDVWRRYDNSHWVWEVRPTGYTHGDAPTEAEAKSAAIAAARGMK